MSYSFPIARRLWRWAKAARRNWLLRHQHPANFYIHLVGIPMALVGVVVLFFLPWPVGLTLFVLGYVLQWIGHRIEGNDVGELIPLKRLLGLPVTPIAPRYAVSADASTKPDVSAKPMPSARSDAGGSASSREQP